MKIIKRIIRMLFFLISAITICLVEVPRYIFEELADIIKDFSNLIEDKLTEILDYLDKE